MVSKATKVNPGIRKIIDTAIKGGDWVYEGCSKHHKLRHKPSGRMVIAAVSTECFHASKNFARDVKHVEVGMPGRGQPQIIERKIVLNGKRVAMLAHTQVNFA